MEPMLGQDAPVQSGVARKLTSSGAEQDAGAETMANAVALATDGAAADVGTDMQSQTGANGGKPALSSVQMNNAPTQASQPAHLDFSWSMTDASRRVSSEAAGVTPTQAVKAEAADTLTADASAVTTGTVADVRTTNGVAQSAASKADAAQANPEVHQRVIDQIVKDVKLYKLQDGTDLTIRLQPAELGSLRIRIVSDAQGMTSQIEASSPQVRNLLQAHVPLLMDALSSAGVRLDSMSVTSTLNFGSLANNLTQQQSQQQNGSSRRGHGSSGVDPSFLSIEHAAGYAAQESVAYSWLA
jgi:hypothetical protein